LRYRKLRQQFSRTGSNGDGPWLECRLKMTDRQIPMYEHLDQLVDELPSNRLRAFRLEFPRGTYDAALINREVAQHWAEETGQQSHPHIRGIIGRPDHPQCPSACPVAPEHLLKDLRWRIYNAADVARSAPVPIGCTLIELEMS
jgi:hypothetical protein